MASADEMHHSAFIVNFSETATFSNHQLLITLGLKTEGRVGRNLGLPHIFWVMDVFILIPCSLFRALASTESMWPELEKKPTNQKSPTRFRHFSIPKDSPLFLNCSCEKQ